MQAQTDNNTGGWWHDMGVVADGINQGKFVNYFPWGDSVHAEPKYHHIGDNDGGSYLQAMALLRLEQGLEDTDNHFFHTSFRTVKSVQYTVIADDVFTQRMGWLAWGINNGGTGDVSDSDGDGYLNTDEITAGSDVLDSESMPLAAENRTILNAIFLLLFSDSQ